MKNDFSSHVCHATIASSSCVSIACTSSSIENDIYVLNKNVDCLGSTLRQYVMNHTRLESMFHKKHAPHIHAHKSRHTHTHHTHTHDSLYANMYTCTHCGRMGHLIKFCYDRIHIQILQISLFGLRKVLTPMDPRNCMY